MPRLVVLPGMDGTGLLLGDFVASLGNDFPVTVLTYPAAEPLSYAQLEERLLPSLPTTEPFFLLGESFGGPLAVALAAKQPVGLLGLILCASFVRYPVSALRAAALLSRVAPAHAAPSFALSWLLLGKWSTPALRSNLAASLAAVSGAALRSRLESALRADVSGLLSRVKVPLLYLRASHDRVVPRSAGATIHNSASQATLVEQAGPHILLQAAPVPCAQLVRRFAGF